MNLKGAIEVLLFWKSEPLTISELSELTGHDSREVRIALVSLVQEYEERNGGLKISSVDRGYILEPKEEFRSLANTISPISLKRSIAKTLSLIALMEPVSQKEIIRERGSAAYDHIKELKEKNWISKQVDGNSYLLRITSECRKLLTLSEDAKKFKIAFRKKLKESKSVPPPNEIDLPFAEGEDTPSD